MAEDDSELESSAVLEELRSGRNLMNGVIPNLPTQQTDRTSFALGSCQYPGGFIDRAVANTSYRDLAQRLLSGDDGPRFVVLTGDQVYTDATAGILDPSIADGRYSLPYNRWLRSRATRTALRQVQSFMLLDDHEIENDWEDENTEDTFREAVSSYKKYQGHSNLASDELFFSFEFDQFQFFMLDTRTRREARTITNIDSANMLDGQASQTDEQFDAFMTWLPVGVAQQTDRPIFIVSPSMLLPRDREAARWGHRASALHSDGWDGYPGSMHKMLVAVAKSSASNVVFLSGDEHIGCIATIQIECIDEGSQIQKTIYSIHTPGLFTPYTFANSGAMDWTPDTNQSFTVGGSDFVYTVTYTPFPGEGFAYINVENSASGWHLTCQFADGPVQNVF